MFDAVEGDSKYLAPEVLSGYFSKKADIFSLGITLLELACDLDLPANGTLWHELRQGSLPPSITRRTLTVFFVYLKVKSLIHFSVYRFIKGFKSGDGDDDEPGCLGASISYATLAAPVSEDKETDALFKNRMEQRATLVHHLPGQFDAEAIATRFAIFLAHQNTGEKMAQIRLDWKTFDPTRPATTHSQWRWLFRQ